MKQLELGKMTTQQHEYSTVPAAACDQVEGDTVTRVFSKEGMPGKSGLEDPASCKQSAPEEPALRTEDSSASGETSDSAPLLPEKHLKKIAVASSPTDDDGPTVVASSASSVVTQAATSTTSVQLQANISRSGNDGIPGYNVSAVPHRQNDASAIVKPSELTDHPGELPRSPRITNASDAAPASAVTIAAIIFPDTQENYAVNTNGGALNTTIRREQASVSIHRRIQREDCSQNGLNRGQDVLAYNGGGPVVDLQRARRLREEHRWSISCLACREENPEVLVKPCRHAILCRRCFLDPHTDADLVSVCPRCCRPSEGLLVTRDMIAFLIRRSAA